MHQDHALSFGYKCEKCSFKASLHDKTSSYKTASNIIEHDFDNVQISMFDRVD